MTHDWLTLLNEVSIEHFSKCAQDEEDEIIPEEKETDRNIATWF